MIKFIVSNRHVVLVLRFLLGLTFIFASIDKISNPAAFGLALEDYRLVSEPLTMIIATVLPWTELLCGLGVLLGIYLRGSSLLLFAMLSAFTLAVLTGMIRGLDIACGCFTLDPDVNRIGWQKVFENVGLIVSSVVLFYSRTKEYQLTASSS